MATYNSTNITFKIDSTSGGTLSALTAYLDRIGNVSVKNGIIVNTPFGAAWVSKGATGVAEVADFDIEGEFDDTATTGPHVILSGARADKSQRTVEVAFGGGKTITFEAYVSAYDYQPTVGAKTRFKATISPTGTVTEA